MNKKLIAVAVAGALAAPALALAASSTVQVYGKITYEYGRIDQGGNKVNTDNASTPGGSAVGFKGEEKLGGGLSAWFQCESSADIVGIGQNGFCSRNSALGLKGAFGNLHFGRWDSPMKRAINMGTVGVQDTGLLGHSFVFAGGSGGTNATVASTRGRWKRRDVGWTYYESPKFGGFQVLAAFTPGNGGIGVLNTATNPKPRVASIGGLFAKGPFSVGLGYEEHQDFNGAGPTTDDDAFSLSAAYKWGPIKVGIAYLDANYDFGGGFETEKKNWNLGVDWTIKGPHAIEAAYTKAGDSKGNGGSPGSGVAAAAPNTGAKLIAIKYRYAFSKRTVVRFGYIRLDNDTGAAYGLAGVGNTAGLDQKAFVMYAEHKF